MPPDRRSLIALAMFGVIAAGCGSTAASPMPAGTPPGATAQSPTSTPTSPPTLAPVTTPTAVPSPAASTTPVPAPPTSASVNAAAAHLKAVAAHFADAWTASTGGPEAMRALYTDDVRLFSGLREWNGIEEMVGLARDSFEAAPEFAVRITATYLGRDEGLVIDEATYAASDPLIDPELHVFTLRGDRIATWQLLIDPSATHDLRGATVDRALLDDYAAAWSSGDPKGIGALYAASAIREDSLFGDVAVGPSAIEDAARRFLARSTSARWELVRGFAEPVGDTAGLFAVHASGPDTAACDVGVGVVLTPGEGGIARERVYYDAASLTGCGWVR